MVAREQPPAIIEAKMIPHVTWRVPRDQAPAIAFNDLPIGEQSVRREGQINSPSATDIASSGLKAGPGIAKG